MMSASAPPRHAFGVRALVVVLVLVAAFIASVHLFLTRNQGNMGPGQAVTPAPTRKVFVLAVDGLRPEDAADPRLTFLAPMRDNGFRAVVQPCMEALTVPCVNEMFSGTATAGLLGAYQNLVAASATDTSSLFADVQALGRTTAVIHHGQYNGFSSALTVSSTKRKEEWEAAQDLIARGVDLIVWHYPKLDEAAHHHRVGSKGYAAAIKALEKQGQALRAALPSAYTLIVYGDHGHTTNGRHIFGLDIPTVFLSDGAMFGTAPVEGRLSMSTYRMLLGAEFGILPPDAYDGVDLGARLPDGSPLRAAATARRYSGPPASDGAPWGVLVAAASALIVATMASRGARAWVLAGGLAAFALGFVYLELVPVVHYRPDLPYVGERIAAGVLGTSALVGLLLAWRARTGSVVAATPASLAPIVVAALALPATLYNYGVFQFLPHAVVALVFVVFGIPAWRAADRAERRKVLALLLVVLGAGYALSEVYVGTFAIKAYPRLKSTPAALVALVWAGLSAALLDVHAGWRGRLVAGLLGGIGASGWIVVDGLPLAAVTTATLVTTFVRPAWLVAVGAWAVPVWYGAADGLAVAWVSILAWAAATLASRGKADDPGARSALLSVLVVALAYLGMAPATGLRTNGLDFNFAIAWLPDDMHLRLWPVVGAGFLVKALFPVALVMLAARSVRPMVERRVVVLAVGARLAGTACAVAGLLVATASPPRYRLFEQLEDMVAWTVVLVMVLGVHAWLERRGQVSAAEASSNAA